MHDLTELLGFLSYLSPIALFFLFLANRRMERRLRTLESASRTLADTTVVVEPVARSTPLHSDSDIPVADAPVFDKAPAIEKIHHAPAAPAAARQPGALALTLDRALAIAGRAARWIMANWFHTISALSLCLAGISAARYAVDQGVLSPALRIALAVGFGAALVAGGEFLRRRFGDEGDVATRHLPSVFSGAGIVTLFGAILSAHGLYDMIGATGAMTLMIAVAIFSIALGWLYGPFLTIIGIVGACATPFLVGGDPSGTALLHGYFFVIAAAGLSMNALRKWRLVDVVSIAFPYGAACVVFDATLEPVPFIILSAAMALLFAGFRTGSMKSPDGGPPVIGALAAGFRSRMRLDTAILAGFWCLAVWMMFVAGHMSQAGTLVFVAALGVMFAISALWSRHSASLSDLPAICAAALFCPLLFVSAPVGYPSSVEAGSFLNGPDVQLLVLIVIVSFAMSLISAARSVGETGRTGDGWTLAAAIIAPGILVSAELMWDPVAILGAPFWSAVVMSLAGAATWAAGRAAQGSLRGHPGGDAADNARPTPREGLGLSLAALVSMSMIALAMFASLSQAALSISLAILVLGAVALDDRFRLRVLSGFAQVGTSVLVYRSLVDPGLFWSLDARLLDLGLAYAVPSLLLAAAWLVCDRARRPMSVSVLEGGFIVIFGIGLSIALQRFIESVMSVPVPSIHWGIGLMAMVWIVSMLASLRNGAAPSDAGAAKSGAMHRAARVVRLISAGVSGLLALVLIGLNLTSLNPLWNSDEKILGTVLLNSLAPGYLFPGLAILAGFWFGVYRTRPARIASWSVGGFLCATYVGLSISQLWRGSSLSAARLGDGEMWSYTVAFIVAGSAFLMVSLMNGSRIARHVGNGLLILAIAKVFLLDATDLDGLARAGSFLVLGLALAGLAWLNRLAILASTAAGRTQAHR